MTFSSGVLDNAAKLGLEIARSNHLAVRADRQLSSDEGKCASASQTRVRI